MGNASNARADSPAPPTEHDLRRILQSAARNSRELLTAERITPQDVRRLFGVEAVQEGVSAQRAALQQLAQTFTEAVDSLERQTSSQILVAAQKRGQLIRNGLVAKKAIVPSGELTNALQITRQALNKALQSGRIFAIEFAGQSYYPAFFADPALVRKHVERVSQALGPLSGWEKWQFFTTPKASLGRKTPVEALKQGEYETVKRAAVAQAER